MFPNASTYAYILFYLKDTYICFDACLHMFIHRVRCVVTYFVTGVSLHRVWCVSRHRLCVLSAGAATREFPTRPSHVSHRCIHITHSIPPMSLIGADTLHILSHPCLSSVQTHYTFYPSHVSRRCRHIPYRPSHVSHRCIHIPHSIPPMSLVGACTFHILSLPCLSLVRIHSTFYPSHVSRRCIHIPHSIPPMSLVGAYTLHILSHPCLSSVHTHYTFYPSHVSHIGAYT